MWKFIKNLFAIKSTFDEGNFNPKRHLSSSQYKYLEQTRWILDFRKLRRRQKNRILACFFIEMALEFRGLEITVLNYTPGLSTSPEIISEIRSILTRYPKLYARTMFYRNTFKILQD